MQEEAATPQATEPTPAAPAAKGGGDDNLIAAISYIGVIAVVILLVKKDSEYVQFHAKQATVLFIGEIAVWVLGMVTWFLFFIWGLVWLVFLVVSIVGFIQALGGNKYKMPVVGDLAEKVNL